MPETEKATERGQNGWWSDLARVLPRVLLGTAGLVCLVVGLKAAWSSSSPTLALIVGAILIALAAVLTPDLVELSAWWKDRGIKLLRTGEATGRSEAYAVVKDAIDTIRSEPDEAVLRKQLAGLAEDSRRAANDELLRALADPTLPATERRRIQWLLLSRQEEDDPDTTVTWITASAESPGIGRTRLTCRASRGAVLLWDVTGPHGETWTTRVFNLSLGSHVESWFPDDFTGPPSAPPGDYNATCSVLVRGHSATAVTRFTLLPPRDTSDS